MKLIIIQFLHFSCSYIMIIYRLQMLILTIKAPMKMHIEANIPFYDVGIKIIKKLLITVYMRLWQKLMYNNAKENVYYSHQLPVNLMPVSKVPMPKLKSNLSRNEQHTLTLHLDFFLQQSYVHVAVVVQLTATCPTI